LGIELTGLLPPASTDGGITPVEQAAFYGDVIGIAQERFGKENGALVRVGVTFGDRDAGQETQQTEDGSHTCSVR